MQALVCNEYNTLFLHKKKTLKKSIGSPPSAIGDLS